MLLVPCFFFSAFFKKRNENAFAIRAAALAARRSGARLAPVSPPAALPTILTRNTREKQKNPKNRASSPEDPAQTLPLHGFVLGGRYARLVQQRLGVPQRVARPRRRRRRRRGRGRGRGHGWRTREWPAGWPAGARGGNFGIGLGDGVRRGRFLGLRRGAFAKGLAFAPRFFSCVFLRAAARASPASTRGGTRAFSFSFSHRPASEASALSPAPSPDPRRGRSPKPRRAAATRASPAATERRSAPNRESRRGPKKKRRARRASSCAERDDFADSSFALLSLPFPRSSPPQPSEPRPSKRGRSEGEGPRRGSAAARARRRCSPFFFHWGFRS